MAEATDCATTPASPLWHHAPRIQWVSAPDSATNPEAFSPAAPTCFIVFTAIRSLSVSPTSTLFVVLVLSLHLAPPAQAQWSTATTTCSNSKRSPCPSPNSQIPRDNNKALNPKWPKGTTLVLDLPGLVRVRVIDMVRVRVRVIDMVRVRVIDMVRVRVNP